MAYYPKQLGTSETLFKIGAASSQPFTLDATAFTTPHTWTLPDSDGGLNYLLGTDGAGNLTWQTDLSVNSITLNQATGSDALVLTNNSAIRGNFSAAYTGSGHKRTFIQTTVANSRTLVPIIPLGTPAISQYTGFQMFENEDPQNSGWAYIGVANSSSGPPSTAQVCKIVGGKNGTGTAPTLGWTFDNTVLVGDGLTAQVEQRWGHIGGNATFYCSGGLTGTDSVFMGVAGALSTATDISFELQGKGNGEFNFTEYANANSATVNVTKPDWSPGIRLSATDDSTTVSIITLNSPSNNTQLLLQSGVLATGDENVVIGVGGAATNIGINLTTQGTGQVNITSNNYPLNQGTTGQYLQTDGAGNTSWQTVSAGASSPHYEEAVATAAQTVFNTTMNTTAKAAGLAYLSIYVNGLFQQEGATKAYTVTGANQITFNAGLNLNDDVVFYGFY